MRCITCFSYPSKMDEQVVHYIFTKSRSLNTANICQRMSTITLMMLETNLNIIDQKLKKFYTFINLKILGEKGSNICLEIKVSSSQNQNCVFLRRERWTKDKNQKYF